MDFDFKITTWERVQVSAEHEQQVLEAIKNGEITSASDVHDFVDEQEGFVETQRLMEVDEQMTIQENGGCSTIEVFDDSREIIYKNGI